MGDSFTHLHLHTEFSMLDGAARVKDVIAAAVSDGQPAIGITDHGNMYGVLDFYKEAKNQGVVPVIGTELYMAAESRHERPATQVFVMKETELVQIGIILNVFARIKVRPEFRERLRWGSGDVISERKKKG